MEEHSCCPLQQVRGHDLWAGENIQILGTCSVESDSQLRKGKILRSHPWWGGLRAFSLGKLPFFPSNLPCPSAREAGSCVTESKVYLFDHEGHSSAAGCLSQELLDALVWGSLKNGGCSCVTWPSSPLDLTGVEFNLSQNQARGSAHQGRSQSCYV